MQASSDCKNEYDVRSKQQTKKQMHPGKPHTELQHRVEKLEKQLKGVYKINYPCIT